MYSMSGSKIDLKVVLLGKSYAGKTSLVERFIHGRFSGDIVPYQNTIGAAFGAKKITIGKTPVVLGIWDTAGSERYEAMSRIYYRGAKAAIVCYDLSDGTSFDRAKFWINELQQNEEVCKVYLCGTKKDIIDIDRAARQVDYHTTTDYADEISAQVYETSSKSGENIEELFKKIAEDFLASEAVLKQMKVSTDSVKMSPEKQKQSSCCFR